jgi:hypothetical protein
VNSWVRHISKLRNPTHDCIAHNDTSHTAENSTCCWLVVSFEVFVHCAARPMRTCYRSGRLVVIPQVRLADEIGLLAGGSLAVIFVFSLFPSPSTFETFVVEPMGSRSCFPHCFWCELAFDFQCPWCFHALLSPRHFFRVCVYVVLQVLDYISSATVMVRRSATSQP